MNWCSWALILTALLSCCAFPLLCLPLPVSPSTCLLRYLFLSLGPPMVPVADIHDIIWAGLWSQVGKSTQGLMVGVDLNCSLCHIAKGRRSRIMISQLYFSV